jgi:hypothetical protein
MAGLLGGLLLWQLGAGRVRVPIVQSTIAMTPAASTAVSSNQNNLRIVNDMILALWTTEREPEERFVETALVVLPAIHVPGSSRVAYALDIPRNGRFESSVYAEGSGEMRFALQFNDELLAEVTAVAGESAQPLIVDLASLAGQGGRLQLVTTVISGEPEGYWQQPQLLAQVDWLLAELPPDVQLAGHRLGEAVSLLAAATLANADGTLTVTLYWQAARPLTENATVFVHLLDENGEMIAQNDAQPVQNSYPLTVWPQGVIVVDKHILPGVAARSLAVGLYNPGDFNRWPVVNPDGTLAVEGRVVLPLETAP